MKPITVYETEDGRTECIDSREREWGQPYFTTHPNMAARCKAVRA